MGNSDVSAIVFNETPYLIGYTLHREDMKKVQQSFDSKTKLGFSPTSFNVETPGVAWKQIIIENKRNAKCLSKSYNRNHLQSVDKIEPGTMISFYKLIGPDEDLKAFWLQHGSLVEGCRAYVIKSNQECCYAKLIDGIIELQHYAKEYGKTLNDTIGKYAKELWSKTILSDKKKIAIQRPQLYKQLIANYGI